ncbi:hypothetical protein CO155_01480 [Candidatus Pacearchaeota archaeon CG_4_9_14_3_um_filter_35_19]|nr:MAG: hypothetical protein AUJ63_04335 [Candidatus Pacearchaeota archaeon CG1_02_35_32]PJA70293.1 MAG: hypothetical protein CO155_01480 [Candidatus Pacearchaeota archaeon CG_4_9_14_3_um_filter_35_19]
MTFVFEITDKTGRKIYLTKGRWTHITSPASLHPYMTNYYKHIKEEKAYLLVGVKYLNGKGFVITSFLIRKIMRR